MKEKMQAIILSEPGGIEKLMYTELPVPVPKEDEVLLKIKAISLNPVDIKTREGKGVYGRIKQEQPLILGWDVSGEVVAKGKNVSSYNEGDEVFGMVNFPGHGKAYAEYITAPAEHLTLKPANISHSEAAAATLAALTAWQVLTQQVQLQKGERILIHAAAGGVGHFAVQIARHLEAYVIGTASTANAHFLQQLGVDEQVDYTACLFEEVIKEVDVVLDAIGGNNIRRSLTTLKKGGRLVSIPSGITTELQNEAEAEGKKAWFYLVQSSGKDMQQIAQLLENGIIKAHVSRSFLFTQMGEAHQQIETGKTRGKIVVTL